MKTFLILACLATCAFAEDYCSSDVCSGSHIACNNNGALGPACGASAKTFVLTAAQKQAFVDGHNKKRNLIAGGFDVYSKAAEMATMSWDDKLANFADMNAKTCKFEHDCHTCEEYPFSGQNLYMGATTAKITSVDSYINAAIEAWFNEYKSGSMAVIDKCQSQYIQSTGHFTAMVKRDNHKLGCGITSYLYPYDARFTAVHVACNYAQTNMLGDQIYKRSGTAASGCKAKNPFYTNLCASGEHSWP